MANRGICAPEMEDAVLNVESRIQQYRGTHGGIVWYYTKKQESGKMLAVVAELYKSICYFVTTFYEENEEKEDSGTDSL